MPWGRERVLPRPYGADDFETITLKYIKYNSIKLCHIVIITLITGFQLVVSPTHCPHSSSVLIALREVCGQAPSCPGLDFQSVRPQENTKRLQRR